MTRLDAIRQREQAATEGPWDDGGGQVLDRSGVIAECFDSIARERGNSQTNAAFIAHARADIPALLAVVEAAGAFMSRWDDRTYIDASDMVGHCWESIAALRAALAPLLEPEP